MSFMRLLLFFFFFNTCTKKKSQAVRIYLEMYNSSKATPSQDCCCPQFTRWMSDILQHTSAVDSTGAKLKSPCVTQNKCPLIGEQNLPDLCPKDVVLKYTLHCYCPLIENTIPITGCFFCIVINLYRFSWCLEGLTEFGETICLAKYQ